MVDHDRIYRMASGILPDGRLIADKLLEKAATDRLLAVAKQGLPPVMVAEEVLPPEVHGELEKDNVRRFIGAVVRVALERHGWVVDRLGARVPGKGPFRTGAVYRFDPASARTMPDSAAEPSVEEDDLLDAMIAGLSPAQRRVLIARLEASLA